MHKLISPALLQVCAPRATMDGPKSGGTLWREGLCTACKVGRGCCAPCCQSVAELM